MLPRPPLSCSVALPCHLPPSLGAQARLAAIDPLRAEEASDSASGLTARRRKLLGLMLAIVVAMAGVVIAMRAPAVPPLPPRRPWGKKRKE